MDKPRLITIPISHYCEKARWALEWTGISYIEEAHLQGFHFRHVKKVTRNDSTPVLVTSEGVYDDSTKILQWADSRAVDQRKIYPRDAGLRAETEALEDYLDEGFGVAGRLWMYTYLLDEVPQFLEFSKKHKVPWYELKLMPLVVPFAKGVFKRLLEFTPTSREDSLRVVNQVLDEVAHKLKNGRRYLVGDRFSAADLTFAALCAPVILPEKYGVPLPGLERLPSGLAEQVKQWRRHPAGIFAKRIYDEHR